MSTGANRLSDIRNEIDAIDDQIERLIETRAQLAIEVAEIKRQTEKEPIYYRPEREAQILRKRAQKYHGLLRTEDITQIYRAIMTACLSLQEQQKIAFLGPLGTFSHSAVLKHFGHTIQTKPASNIEQIFREVEAKHVHYGVVPIENSTTGIINSTLDYLMNSPLYICGEISLPIHQNFMRLPNHATALKCIYSHEQSLMQCKNWLAQNYPDVKQVPVSSNAHAAELAAKDENTAAIAGEIAAEIYNLEIIARQIEDNAQNTTRFIIIGHQKVLPSGNDKTSILFATPHSPGALLRLIQPFAEYNINVTSIESRPYQHRNWSYIFFLDIEGHQDNEAVKKALHEISQQPILITILGSYPKAII